MSGSIAKKLRVGIIDKLKEYDCYIDNDLPDYIMVMIANKKSTSQMKEDLSLFVGDQVGEFVDWLHDCLEEIKLGNDPFVKQETCVPEKKLDLAEKEGVVVKPQHIIGLSCQESVSISTNKASNEESKENTKRDRTTSKVITTRKEITFTNEDKIRLQSSTKNQIEPSVKRPQHKPIEHNAGEEVVKQTTTTKRARNQIIFDSPSSSISLDNLNNSNERSQTEKRNVIAVHSRTNYNATQQSTARVSASTQHLTNSVQNYKKPSSDQLNKSQFASAPSHQQTSFNDIHQKLINHRHEQREHARTSARPLLSVIQKFEVKKEVRVESTSKQQSMLAKAIAEANKQSSLKEISLRKVDSESPNRSLVNRLGLPATKSKPEQQIAESIQTKPNDAENEVARRERRLAKFGRRELIRHQNSVVEMKTQTIHERTLETSKPLKDEDCMDVDQNLKKEDLRVTLSKKRKLDGALNEPTKKASPRWNAGAAIENDEELKKLRNEIKPKTVLVECKKDENKRDDDSDENVNVIIKRELLEKIKTIQATVDEHKNRLKTSGKELITTKKERCHYWPLCTNNDCQYHHPKTICLQFPYCKFGVNCLNIHPNCKFDSKCANPICPYTHLTRKLAAPKAKAKLLSTIHPIQKIQPVINTIKK